MKKKTVILTLLMLISLLAIPSIITYAGSKNQNDEPGKFAGKSVERGTGKINHKDGCRPGVQAGNVWIWIPPEILPPGWLNVWEGAPCCAHRAGGPHHYNVDGEPVFDLNQCCNPSDEGPIGVPGNHCLCFMNRDWPIPNALPLPP